MNQIGQFILTYFTEILIIIALVAMVLLYFIVKQRQKDTKHDDIKSQDEIPNKKENIIADTNIKKDKQDRFQYHIIQKKRQYNKGSKITKENFKIFNGLEIIVADDNPINQKVIINLLAGSGIKIQLADNGKDVLDILNKQNNISIILMDAHMPILDGLEASKIIKKNNQFDNILIIALSGDVATDDTKQMQRAGMQEHLEKPLKLDKLFELLYTYTDDTITSISPISNILNMDDGIEICGGDIQLYKDILREFIISYRDIGKKLSKNLVKNDLESSSHILLDISGIAANIGADKLAKLATQYREAITNHSELKYDELNNNFNEQLHKVFNTINKEL